MAEDKYGKYIITDLKPGLNIPGFRAESSDRMTHLRWLGDAVIQGSPHVECVWIWRASPGTGPTPHTHDFDEILGFFGTNSADPEDLGADVELWLEDEKHIFSKSCLVYIPKGMKHCPLRSIRLDTPVFHFMIAIASQYSGEVKA
jgi:hypothetical protein